MKSIKYFLAAFFSLLCICSYAQDVPPVTINVATAGTLPSLITSIEKYEITNLTVTGDLNGTDILYLREMAGSDVNGNSTVGKLSVLDLSGVNIVDGGSSYYSTLHTSLNKIGDVAFYGCTTLTSIIIPKSVISIGESAFNHCTTLTSIIIPNGVISIGESAFYGCIALPSITIPSSVISIGVNAFYGCTKLKEFIVSGNSTTYSSVDGVLFSKNLTELIAYPYAKSNIYTIPNSVTSIGDYAFGGCTGFTEIHCKTLIPPNATYKAFFGINMITCKLYIPKGTYANYWPTAGWGNFTNIIEEKSTTISQIKASNIKVYTDQDAIIVVGADLGDNISVYTESGALLQTIKVTDNTIRIAVPGSKIYFIKTTDKTFKVAL